MSNIQENPRKMLQHDVEEPKFTSNYGRFEDQKENQARIVSNIIKKAILEERKEIGKKVNEELEYRKLEEYSPENNYDNSSVTVSLPNDLIYKIKESSIQYYGEKKYEGTK